MSERVELTFKLTVEDFNNANIFRLSTGPTKVNPIKRWLLMLVYRHYARKGEKANNLPPTTHIFDGEGVQVLNLDDPRTEPWSYFSEVVEYPEGYLFVKEKQILLVVPKGAFTDQFKYEVFRNLVRRELGLNAKINSLL